jgi:hypothetical protein
LELAQLQIVYDALQDRLLMRVNTTSSHEVRAWLTRRLLSDLWATWQRAVTHARGLALPAGASPDARAALVSMEREQAVATSDFSTPFGKQPTAQAPAAQSAPSAPSMSPYSMQYRPPAPNFPLGEAPLLINEVSLTPLTDGSLQTHWKDGNRTLGIVMNAQLMHAVTKLLADGAAQAQWAIDIDLPDPAHHPAEGAAQKH